MGMLKGYTAKERLGPLCYSVQNKRRLPGLDIVVYIFYSNHCTKHVDQVEVSLLDVYN